MMDKVVVEAVNFLRHYVKQLFKEPGTRRLLLADFLAEEYGRYSSLYFIRAETLVKYVKDYRRKVDAGKVKEMTQSIGALASAGDLNDREYLRYAFATSFVVARWAVSQRRDIVVNYKLTKLLDDVVYNDGPLQLTLGQLLELYSYALQTQGFSTGAEPVRYLESVDGEFREAMKAVRAERRKKRGKPFKVVYAPLYLSNVLQENCLAATGAGVWGKSCVSGLGMVVANSLIYLSNAPNYVLAVQSVAQAIKAAVVAQRHIFTRLDLLLSDDAKKLAALIQQYYAEYVKEGGYAVPQQLEYGNYAAYQDIYATLLAVADVVAFAKKRKYKSFGKILEALNIQPPVADKLAEKLLHQARL